MKVLVCDPIAPEGIAVLRNEFEVDEKTGLTPDELKSIVKDYDAVIVRSETRITEEILAAGKKIRVVGRAGAGVDNIDIETATKLGVMVVNVPDGNTISAAEHAICLLLSLSKNLAAGFISLKERKWKRSELIGHQVFGKVLGIIGLGRIGRLVAEYAKGLKMQVLAYDPYLQENVVKEAGVRPVSLPELLRESDYITLHVPLTNQTRRIISEKEIGMMKKGAMIVNCARGGLIEEEALFNALKTGALSGAALDVFEKEPPLDNPLLTLPNVVATPHLGASTREAQINVSLACAKQVLSALKGEFVDSVVNLPFIEPEFLAKFYPYVSLAEKLGSLQGQLAEGPVGLVEITYSGELNGQNTTLLTIAVIKGLLKEMIPGTVSYVNAKILAGERGVLVVEKQSSEYLNFSNLISVTVRVANKERQVAGTIFNGNEPKIVLMDGVHIDADPAGYLLIVTNKDKPGVVGTIGTILGNNSVNIAGIYLGRQAFGGKAVSIVNVDCQLPARVIKEINELPLVTEAKLVRL